jgi:hypothetical protein
MKIKIKGGLKVELNTLVRLQWKGWLPMLTIHERFEKPVKWILRILTFIGIATSLVTIDEWYLSLGLALILLGVEQFFERAVFEYTTIVMLPLPDFDIDYSQWKTNGFRIANVVTEEIQSYMGPSFVSRDYAIRFFNYLMSWNWDSNIDDENSIVVSIVIEPNEKYTTYIYSNPQNKKLDIIFNQQAKQNELSKYGKQQQKLFTQMIFYNTLDFKPGYFIEQFLNRQSPNQKFNFVPSVLPNQHGQEPEFLYDYAIVKFGYRLKNRNQIGKNDVEYYLKPN